MNKLIYLDDIERFGSKDIEVTPNKNKVIVDFLIKQELNKIESKVIYLRLQNRKIKEIAIQLKISEIYVKKIIKKSIKILSNAFVKYKKYTKLVY